MKFKLIYLFFLIFSFAVILSCGSEANKTSSEPKLGKALYSQYCTLCHGSNGDAGLGGAKNLRASTMTDEEKTSIINLGKGNMQGFSQKLTKGEVKRVIEYINTLKD